MCRRAEVSEHSVRLLLLPLDALARMPEGGCKSQRRADLMPCCPRGSCVLRVGHGQRQPWGGTRQPTGRDRGSETPPPSSAPLTASSTPRTATGGGPKGDGSHLLIAMIAI